MRYMLNIYDAEARLAAASPDEGAAMHDAYMKVAQEIHAAGVFVAGDALQRTRTATVVRVRDGERLVTDGPYAETKEQLGGFWVLECRDLDEALEWAAKIPGAQTGSVEVRPVMDYDAVAGASAGEEAQRAS